MTDHRSRIVAGQAIVVGVLMVVVSLTLLRPDGDSGLFGVTTPGEAEDVVQGPRQRPDRDDRRGDGERAGDGRETRFDELGDAPAGEAPLGGSDSAPIVPGPGTSPGPTQDESPARDQYADAVARLSAKLY